MDSLERWLLDRLGDKEMAQRLATYVNLLESWSKTHNLVRFCSRDELLERHVLEALPFAETMAENGRLVDIGSGAGLPGIPLLVARPGWNGLLLEPRRKRWAFLRVVVRELGLDATVSETRYQEIVGDEVFDLVTARAVGQHEEVASWASAHLKPGGALVLWVGEEDEQRLRDLPGWRVLSSPVVGLDHARLLRLEPCFT